MKFRFFGALSETKIAYFKKIGWFEKSEIKLPCATEQREKTLGSSYWGLKKIEGARLRDSTVCVSLLLVTLDKSDS